MARDQRGGARDARPYRDRTLDIFTRTQEGRRYEHGVAVRPAVRYSYSSWRPFFPSGYCHYPHYSVTYSYAEMWYSPYRFYFGVLPPYVYRRHCHYGPPAVVYIEVPVYVDHVYRGYSSRDTDYYLSNRWWRDGGYEPDDVRRSAEQLEDAFRYSDINALADLTNQDVRIAIYQKGRYEYSLDAGDYLDMTRDFMRSAETVRFDVLQVRRRTGSVYSFLARHDYRNRDGDDRTVYVSFVVERRFGRWVISQVGMAPERDDF